MIKENISEFSSGLLQHVKRCGRDPKDVTLIAVSKTKPAEAVREAILCGMADSGKIKFRKCVT